MVFRLDSFASTCAVPDPGARVLSQSWVSRLMWPKGTEELSDNERPAGRLLWARG